MQRQGPVHRGHETLVLRVAQQRDALIGRERIQRDGERGIVRRIVHDHEPCRVIDRGQHRIDTRERCLPTAIDRDDHIRQLRAADHRACRAQAR